MNSPLHIPQDPLQDFRVIKWRCGRLVCRFRSGRRSPARAVAYEGCAFVCFLLLGRWFGTKERGREAIGQASECRRERWDGGAIAYAPPSVSSLFLSFLSSPATYPPSIPKMAMPYDKYSHTADPASQPSPAQLDSTLPNARTQSKRYAPHVLPSALPIPVYCDPDNTGRWRSGLLKP